MSISLTEGKKVRAFTLVELMITVVIIGILATMAIVKYGPVSEKAHSAEAYSILAQIASAENVYRLEGGSYTSTIADLDIDTPTSQNFTFSVPSTSSTAAYVSARCITGKATKSYCVCLRGGKQGSASSCNSSSACNPSCP